MQNNLSEEKILLDKSVGSETSQFLIEGDIIVPDAKPDISYILQTEENIIIDKKNITRDRINFMGCLNLNVLYIAKSSESLLYSIDVTSPIDNFLNIDGITDEMYSNVSAKINNIDYKILNDRKINYRAVINITANISEEHELSVVTGIKNISTVRIKKINVNYLVENRNDRFIVKDELNLTSDKPNIGELLNTSIDIVTRDAKCGNGKITTNGELIIKCLYKSDSPENFIQIFEHEVPFNGIFDVPKSKDSMNTDVKLYIQDKRVQIKANSDGEDRIIDIEIFVGANINIDANQELEILSDAYHVEQKLDINNELIKYKTVVCKNKTQVSVKEIVQLDKNCPDILQILKVNAIADIDDTHIIDDKVIVEGVIHAEVLYVAQNDRTPLYVFKSTIPYRQIIETKNALSTMDTDINVETENIGTNLLSSNELELRFLLSFNTKVKKTEETDVIVNIEFHDIDKEVLSKIPSMIIYIVEQNDTLWKIAKKYNIDPEKLKNVNELENDSIYAGQKILILKNINQ
jgi:LysM repeat protein